jgi:ATP-dependent Clp protease ATP-binding subunit ClpA
VTQRSQQADRVLDLARVEADLLGHRYLGPEHLVLGVLGDGGSGASQILEASGINLTAARAELCRLAERGLVPGPRPSDAELLNTLGIDLAAIRRHRADLWPQGAGVGGPGGDPGATRWGWAGAKDAAA